MLNKLKEKFVECNRYNYCADTLSELEKNLLDPTCYFEIHITVEEISEKFQRACTFMGAKAIVIAAGEGIQPMSSWKNKVTHSFALGMMQFQIQHLEAFDCKVVRAKLESDLTHPSCNFKLPHQYFESHIQVKVKGGDVFNLGLLAKDLGLHISANAFKVTGDDQIRMLTYRSYIDSPKMFQSNVAKFRWQIAQHYELAKEMECEFALYDTNIGLDNRWINGLQ